MSALPAMTAIAPARPQPEPEVHVRLDGTFDAAAAWSLRGRIDEAATSAARVVLDFTAVREFYDFGVAVLAHGLAQRPQTAPAVSLRGLRTHQLRMFRYLGVDAERD